MPQTRHTPGPWNKSGGIIQGVNSVMVADARLMSEETAAQWGLQTVRSYPEFEANAALIAAAPELYSGLKLAIEVLHTKGESGIARHLDEIIHTATGR